MASYGENTRRVSIARCPHSCECQRELVLLARTRILLVGCDFDGTLAPLVAQPSDAAAASEALAALQELSQLPHTYLTVISGRGLADLRTRVPALASMVLAGSHGAEVEGEQTLSLPPHVIQAMEEVGRRGRALTAQFVGALIETKPRSVAFHFREVDPDEAPKFQHKVQVLARDYPLLSLQHGSKVIEVLAGDINKGHALRTIRVRTRSTGVFYAGDDLTDEDVFAVLGPSDMSVKVGEGPTRAAYRVASPADVASLLHMLADARRRVCVGNARSGKTPGQKDGVS